MAAPPSGLSVTPQSFTSSAICWGICDLGHSCKCKQDWIPDPWGAAAVTGFNWASSQRLPRSELGCSAGFQVIFRSEFRRSSYLDNFTVKFLQLMNEMASTGHQTTTKKTKGNTEDFRRLQPKNTKVNLPLLKPTSLQAEKFICMQLHAQYLHKEET